MVLVALPFLGAAVFALLGDLALGLLGDLVLAGDFFLGEAVAELLGLAPTFLAPFGRLAVFLGFFTASASGADFLGAAFLVGFSEAFFLGVAFFVFPVEEAPVEAVASL